MSVLIVRMDMEYKKVNGVKKLARNVQQVGISKCLCQTWWTMIRWILVRIVQ